MEIRRFYSVSPKSFDYFANAGVVDYDLKRHKCTECGAVLSENIMPPFDYVIEGKRLGDIMSILPGYYLVSLRVYELFISNNISGVSFSRDVKCVKWVDRKGKAISQTMPEYVYMIIDGKCGEVYLQNGKSIPRCPKCSSLKCSAVIKTAFNISNWDKSDVFTHSGATGMICTEKVKELIEKNKLKNFEITPCRYTSRSGS
ncbi:MAG: hypothetical protein ACI4RH_00190 [Huintestinicola sp.]